MSSTIYHLRDSKGLYLSFDKHSALLRTEAPATPGGVTGVPEQIKGLESCRSLTFTDQARHLLARVYFVDGGNNATCRVEFDGQIVELKLAKATIRADVFIVYL